VARHETIALQRRRDSRAGHRRLYDALRDMAEVHIVAPEAERSAVGHAITIYNPLKSKKIYKNGEFYGYAVDGTPADCVKLAVSALLPGPPDFIISGINLGPNAGISVIYSGTVSAATEGIILGIPSMAISMNTFADPIWDTAKKVAREMLKRLTEDGLPQDTLLNVNVPNIPFEELKGTRVTRMGKSRYIETFERRSDPRGNAITGWTVNWRCSRIRPTRI
jgi:5'-nucleotidase